MFREGTVLKQEGKYNIIRLRDGTSHHTVINASSVPITAGDVVVCEEIDQNPSKMVIIGVYKEFTAPDPPQPEYICFYVKISSDGYLIANYHYYRDIMEIELSINKDGELVVKGDNVVDARLYGSDLLVKCKDSPFKQDCKDAPTPQPDDYICFRLEVVGGFLYTYYRNNLEVADVNLSLRDKDLVVDGVSVRDARLTYDNYLIINTTKPINTKCN